MKYKFLTLSLLLTAVLVIPLYSADAATCTWDGGGDGSTANDADNWDATCAGVPGTGDLAVFDAGAGATAIDWNINTFLGGMLLDTGYTGTTTMSTSPNFNGGLHVTVNSGTLDINGQGVYSTNMNWTPTAPGKITDTASSCSTSQMRGTMTLGGTGETTLCQVTTGLSGVETNITLGGDVTFTKSFQCGGASGFDTTCDFSTHNITAIAQIGTNTIQAIASGSGDTTLNAGASGTINTYNILIEAATTDSASSVTFNGNGKTINAISTSTALHLRSDSTDASDLVFIPPTTLNIEGTFGITQTTNDANASISWSDASAGTYTVTLEDDLSFTNTGSGSSSFVMTKGTFTFQNELTRYAHQTADFGGVSPTFYNLTINNTATSTGRSQVFFDQAQTIDINGNLTITDGNLDLDTYSSDAIDLTSYGDSLSSGDGDWHNAIPTNWSLSAEGVPGQSSWNGAATVETEAAGLTTDIVSVMWGTNDVRDGSYTLASSTTNIARAVDALLSAGHKVVLGAAPPLYADGAETAATYRARLVLLRDELREMVLSRQAQGKDIEFADTYSEILLSDDPSSLYADGIHPDSDVSGDGSRSVANPFLKAIGRLITNTSTINLAGNLTIGTGGRLDYGNAMFTFDGGTTQTFIDNSTVQPFEDFFVSNNSTLALGSSATTTYAYIGSGSTIDLGSSGYTFILDNRSSTTTPLVVDGAFTTGSDSTVLLKSRATSTIPTATFDNLTLDSSGITFSTGGVATVGGVFLNSNATLVETTGYIANNAALTIDDSSYAFDGTISITLTDADENAISASTDTVNVALTLGSDTETVTLTETGVITGLFTGSIAINNNAISSYNGSLNLPDGIGNTTVTVAFTDAEDNSDSESRTAIVVGRLIGGSAFGLYGSGFSLPNVNTNSKITIPNIPNTPTGSLLQGNGSGVYFYGSDNKRYVFPDEKTFRTWYPNFNSVKSLSVSDLQIAPLAGNVTYRPGVRMLKITTDPKVYAVSKNGTLKWIKTEKIAETLYGPNWNTYIDDVVDSIFASSYIISDEVIEDASQFTPKLEQDNSSSIDSDKGLRN